MSTEQLTYPQPTLPSDSFRIDVLTRLGAVFSLLRMVFRSLFVIDAPLREAHGGLIRGLFVAYFFIAFFIFGPLGMLIMPFYQIGFKQLLRAAFQG